MVDSTDVLGVTICDECEARIKLRQKHTKLIGKSIRCPKCHSSFVCKLSKPTPTEKAAIESDTESKQSQRKKRRSKAEVREEYINNVRDGFRSLHARLSDISKAEKASEEQVRIWCVDALRTALGYSDDEIDTETRANGKRVDIALKQKDKIFMVIECKNIKSALRKGVRDQAVNYATSLSAEWAVITNGQVWRLFKVIPQKGKEAKVIEVFDVALLDDDGVSEDDAELLYLLTSRAIFKGDAEKMYHAMAATSSKRILRSLESEKVIKAITSSLREQYKKDTEENVSLDSEVVGKLVSDLFDPLEL